MKEIVIVPAWKRPDFLGACLARLATALEPQQAVWVSLDRRHDTQVAQIAADFRAKVGAARVRIIERYHGYRGNSFNVLQAYREAIEANPDLIHLVEEDVFVGADYFAFHRSAHALAPEAFAISGARNQNYMNDPQPFRDALYRAPQYQSVAVSFRPERLSAVLPHVSAHYFRGMVDYCRRNFPESKIPVGNAEQDGLLNRLVEAGAGWVWYPALPRAYHAGFVGYNRKGEAPKGNLEKRIAMLLRMDGGELNRRAHSYPDHKTVDLDAAPGPVTRIIEWP